MINNEKIQAFLNVVQYRNITAAANAIFVTQSYMSKQIRALEEELGTKLIIRSKGHSEISLTPHGKEFLELARKWEGVMKDIDNVPFSDSITEISIGALDRINSFTLRDFYRSVLNNYPDIRLDCHTRHSKEIYTMMENHQLDLGLVSVLYPVYNINVQALYTETMFVICAEGNDLPPIVKPSDLDPELEIYSRWSDEFEVWHDQLWPGKKYRIHVGTSTMTPHYLNKPGRWSVVPVSALHGLKENYTFTIHRLAEAYPAGKIYLLEQKHPRQSRAESIELIRDSLLEHLRNDQHLKIYKGI